MGLDKMTACCFVVSFEKCINPELHGSGRHMSLGKKFATIWQCIEEGYISKACRQGLLKLLKKCLVLVTEGEKDRACRRHLLNMSVRKPLNLVPQEQWWARAMEKLHGSCKNFCYTTACREGLIKTLGGWVGGYNTHMELRNSSCVW